jgi:lipopolysaccharide export LptBFGC system permease protein LptF
VILCALLAFGYYALVTFCESLANEKGFPPRLAAWLPNLAYAAVGTALLVRARRSS